jgi:hypothetical protein
VQNAMSGLIRRHVTLSPLVQARQVATWYLRVPTLGEVLECG